MGEVDGFSEQGMNERLFLTLFKWRHFMMADLPLFRIRPALIPVVFVDLDSIRSLLRPALSLVRIHVAGRPME